MTDSKYQVDVNGDTLFNAADYAQLRADVVATVRRQFEPFDVGASVATFVLDVGSYDTPAASTDLVTLHEPGLVAPSLTAFTVRAGCDILIGGLGADKLDGGTEDDVLVGGATDDLLGGADLDWFWGVPVEALDRDPSVELIG